MFCWFLILIIMLCVSIFTNVFLKKIVRVIKLHTCSNFHGSRKKAGSVLKSCSGVYTSALSVE